MIDQERFTEMYCSLLMYLLSKGYKIRQNKVTPLAANITFMKGGEEVLDIEHYRAAGEFWEAMEGVWGGRDYNGHLFMVR